MRFRCLPKNFQFVARHVLPDLPVCARSKLEVISLVERLMVGSTVSESCWSAPVLVDQFCPRSSRGCLLLIIPGVERFWTQVPEARM